MQYAQIAISIGVKDLSFTSSVSISARVSAERRHPAAILFNLVARFFVMFKALISEGIFSPLLVSFCYS